jgi:hypothetical protein
MCDVAMRTGRGRERFAPRWGVLYAVATPPILALVALEAGHIPHAARTILRCLVALGVFVAMGIWLRANRAAFDLQNWCDCAGQRLTVRIIESRAAAPYRPLVVPESAEPERVLVEH